MTQLKRISFLVFCVTAIVMITSCNKDNTSADTGINYPAAYVVNGGSNSLSVININTDEVSQTINLEILGVNDVMYPHHVYHHNNGDIHHLTIAIPGMDFSEGHSGGMVGMPGKAMILDAANGKLVHNIELPVMNHNATYSPDGTEIWTAQMMDDGEVLIYDAITYSLKNTVSAGMMPAEITFSADGTKAYVCNGMSNTVTVINPADKSVLATIAVGEDPVGAWPGNDGKMYVDNEMEQSISVIDVASDAVVQTIDIGFMPGFAAHLASAKELWVTDPDNGKVHYWNWDAGMNMWMHGGSFETGMGAHAIAFTADSKKAYITNQMAASVSVIDVATHTKIKDIATGSKPNGITIIQ